VQPDPIGTLLPWKHPFLMVDRVVEVVPHVRIVTRKSVTCGDAMAGEGQPDGVAVLG